ncbi:MAG: serine/threonine-protein kinase [Euryarchaeota archaeon]|nr:serine/threonine-protein kinase [Euryarchaeota archaeon]
MGSKIKINNKSRLKRMASILPGSAASAGVVPLERTHSMDLMDSSGQTPPFCRTHLGITRFQDRYIKYLNGRYELTKKVLGKGVYGKVVAAIDHGNHGQMVAIKIQNMAGRSQSICDVKREAMLGMNIPTHPNVCKTIDWFQLGKTFYIVMEIVEGESFQAYMLANPLTSVNVHTFLELLRQMALAIAHVHKNGYVHRDIKPANFIVVCGGEKIGVKLTDFGFSSSIKRIEQVTIGTPIFFAPEVANKFEISEKCDIWALGVLISQILTGKELPVYLEGVTCSKKASRIIGKLSVNPFPAKLTENENRMFALIAKVAKRCLEIAAPIRPSAAEIAAYLEIARI